MLESPTKTKEKIKELFEQVLGASLHYNIEIAPVLGMFSDISGVALKTLNAPKSEWGDIILESSKEYMNDTNKLVNGVILINEARMMKLSENAEDHAKILHYIKVVGSIDGCPYATPLDVVLCACTFRDNEKILFVTKVKHNQETGERSFSEVVDMCENDGLSSLGGALSDIAKQAFGVPPAYQNLSC